MFDLIRGFDYNFKEKSVMDEQITKLKEKVSNLQLWVFLLFILLFTSLGFNVYNLFQIRHNTVFISEILEEIDSSHQIHRIGSGDTLDEAEKNANFWFDLYGFDD